MASLVERVRLVLAVEDDDFYNDTEDIVEALNASQNDVISYGLAVEKNQNRSLRALDALRDVADIVLDNSRAVSDFYISDVSVPVTLKNFLSVTYNELTPLTELSASRVNQLLSSNAIPTVDECYYIVTSGNFKVYLYEAPDQTSDKIEVYHIKNPTQIELATESLAELPSQLENAVVYGAAVQLALKEQSEATSGFRELYNEYLKTNLF